MTITIENIEEAAMAAKALTDWLDWAGNNRGHSTSCCGCRICVSLRNMRLVRDELRDAARYERNYLKAITRPSVVTER